MGLSSSMVGGGIEDTVKKMKICCIGEEEEGECEWIDRPDHPLLNNLVLGNVFKHLSCNCLKECRLVCKTWNILTLPFTRKAFHFTVYPSDTFRDSREKRTIENLTECLSSNNLGIPFGSFTLAPLCRTYGVDQKFLQMCGPTISSLQFVDGYHIALEDISEILRTTPSLETFRIPNRLRSRDGNIVKLFPEDSNTRLTSLKTLIFRLDFPIEREEFCPTFLEELIKAAANISCFELYDSRAYAEKHWRREDSESVEYYGKSSSLQILSLIEKLGRESAIQSLKITNMEREQDELIELLHGMTRKPNGLKLKLFHYTSYKSNQNLIRLVSHFNDTLQNLKIDSPCSSFMEFRKMLRLTRLAIFLPQDFNFKYFNFGNIFPVMEELELNMRGPDQEYNEFSPESEPCPHMKSLVISQHRVNINGFNQILRIFPNLTKLQMTIGSDCVKIFRKIWTQLTQLKYLNIRALLETEDSLDSILTGISALGIQEIGNTLKNINKRKTALERRGVILKLRDQHCRLPSIANLTDLRLLMLDLRIEGDTGGGSKTYMTDLTGYLGFYSMKRLKCLQLEYCELTKTCCEVLIKDVGLESWRFGIPNLKCIISSVYGTYYYGPLPVRHSLITINLNKYK